MGSLPLFGENRQGPERRGVSSSGCPSESSSGSAASHSSRGTDHQDQGAQPAQGKDPPRKLSDLRNRATPLSREHRDVPPLVGEGERPPIHELYGVGRGLSSRTNDEMKMRTRAPTRAAVSALSPREPDPGPPFDRLTRANIDPAHVNVGAESSSGVPERDVSSVHFGAARCIGAFHDARSHRIDGGALGNRDIDPVVEYPFSGDGVFPHPEKRAEPQGASQEAGTPNGRNKIHARGPSVIPRRRRVSRLRSRGTQKTACSA
jgi:hypothetical protein